MEGLFGREVLEDKNKSIPRKNNLDNARIKPFTAYHYLYFIGASDKTGTDLTNKSILAMETAFTYKYTLRKKKKSIAILILSCPR